MNTKALTDRFDDVLEPLGITAGVFLVLMGIGTIVGAPWVTNPDVVAVVLKLIGALATIALGAGLAYLSWAGER